MVSTIQMGRGDEPGRINWTRAAASASELKKVNKQETKGRFCIYPAIVRFKKIKQEK